MVYYRLYGNDRDDPYGRENHKGLRKENTMFLGLVAAITTRVATEIFLSGAPAADDPLEQLSKLSKLKDAGVISPEEFEEKKAALLAKI